LLLCEVASFATKHEPRPPSWAEVCRFADSGGLGEASLPLAACRKTRNYPKEDGGNGVPPSKIPKITKVVEGTAACPERVEGLSAPVF